MLYIKLLNQEPFTITPTVFASFYVVFRMKSCFENMQSDTKLYINHEIFLWKHLASDTMGYKHYPLRMTMSKWDETWSS